MTWDVVNTNTPEGKKNLSEALKVAVDGADLVAGTSEWKTWETPAPNTQANKKTHTVSVMLPIDAGNDYQETSATISFKVEAVQANAVASVAEINEKMKDNPNQDVLLYGCNEPDSVVVIPAEYKGTLTLNNAVIKSVQAEADANIIIEGDVVINANGSDVATATETETTFDGSAITANGVLNISGTGNLTAIAADVKAAFGIGGMKVSELNIKDVHIVKVTGAGVNSKIGQNYGKQDFEGAPAIGSGYSGAMINLNNVTVEEALGGSKGAGIGARYHTGVTISITDSTIKNVVGGSSSAAIGGSRMTQNVSGDTQNITITITNSTVNATGGDFAAAIGSGYNTYCATVTPTPVISVTIDAASNITAQGGWLGAGIGTGHNAIGFVGNIACDTSNVKAGSSEDPEWCCPGNPCTTAEDVGRGVLSIKNFSDILGTYVTSADGLAIAVANGATSVMLAAGEYTLPDSLAGKTLTISGTKDVKIDLTTATGQTTSGANLVFDGVTLNFDTVNYEGIQHASSVVYKNCQINGLQFLYASTVDFIDCDLNSGDAEHCVWTYGAETVNFTDCDFVYNDRCVNAYADSSPVQTVVNFKDCTFTTQNIESKGAVEINSSLFEIGITVNMESCTAPKYGAMAYVSEWDSTCGDKTTININ